LLHESPVTFNDTDILVKENIKLACCWEMTPFNCVRVFRRFGGSYCLHLNEEASVCHIRHKASDTQAHVQRYFTCFPLNSPPSQTQPPSSDVSWKSGFTALPTSDSYTCFLSLVVVWASELSFLSGRPRYCVPR
jgi:hypothetical protein